MQQCVGGGARTCGAVWGAKNRPVQRKGCIPQKECGGECGALVGDVLVWRARGYFGARRRSGGYR